jgi:hypothetical protein
MCLDTVSSEKPPAEGYFWKIFYRIDGSLMTLCGYLKGIHRGKWLTANDEDWSEKYEAGFHGYANSSQEEALAKWAKKNAIYLCCQYRGGHTMGTQHGLQVIVAREMRILLPSEKVPKPRKRLSSRKRVEA